MPTENNKQKYVEEKIIFVGILKVTDYEQDPDPQLDMDP
jgi:hypothetical protein